MIENGISINSRKYHFLRADDATNTVYGSRQSEGVEGFQRILMEATDSFVFIAQTSMWLGSASVDIGIITNFLDTNGFNKLIPDN